MDYLLQNQNMKNLIDIKKDIYKGSAISTLKINKTEFLQITRMYPVTFKTLMSHLNSTSILSFSEAANPEYQLFITLEYLSKGYSKRYLSMKYNIPLIIISQIINETCFVITETLKPFYLKRPNADKWRDIADDYKTEMDLPNCVGAMDVRRIQVICPPKSCLRYNCKGHMNLILLAVCDTNYMFTVINITFDGKKVNPEDTSLISKFGRKFICDIANIPDSINLPSSDLKFPHYFIVETMLPIKTNLMRPYHDSQLTEDQKFYNEKLTIGQITIDNTFHILCKRWRILRKPLHTLPKLAENIVEAVILLHNFLQIHEEKYGNVNLKLKYIIAHRLWRRKSISVSNSYENIRNKDRPRSGLPLRDILKTYFWTLKEDHK